MNIQKVKLLLNIKKVKLLLNIQKVKLPLNIHRVISLFHIQKIKLPLKSALEYEAFLLKLTRIKILQPQSLLLSYAECHYN